MSEYGESMEGLATDAGPRFERRGVTNGLKKEGDGKRCEMTRSQSEERAVRALINGGSRMRESSIKRNVTTVPTGSRCRLNVSNDHNN